MSWGCKGPLMNLKPCKVYVPDRDPCSLLMGQSETGVGTILIKALSVVVNGRQLSTKSLTTNFCSGIEFQLRHLWNCVQLTRCPTIRKSTWGLLFYVTDI